MIKEKEISRGRNGFTLVELLAVIVILAIILVIAVPKVMSIIEDAKKGTLESTAKMIASAAEKAKVQNTVLGKTEEITCESVAKINKGDYANCSIEFDNNTAKVTIEGSGKFDGLWVCGGTKTNATAQKDVCSSPLEVKHPLFLAGQELTPEKFEVTLTDNDGNVRKLYNGIETYVSNEDAVTITSPNWPNNYPANMTEEENYWEYTFEDAVEIQIMFDETSSLNYDYECVEECELDDYGYSIEECEEYECNTGNTYITIYDNDGLVREHKGSFFSGETYTIRGNYIKVTMVSDSETTDKGFSATIKPVYKPNAEYTISPSVAPFTGDKFDITITVKDQNISKKISAKTMHNVEDYMASLEPLETNIQQTTATYNGTTYDAGIRYVGAMDEVNNKVYYNCDDTDTNGVTYGNDDYDYASSCEVWRIIGVFDTKTNINSIPKKRVKIINSNSTFQASWDSSASDVNKGYGINQWGPSDNYEGADIMQLLNGYYIGLPGSECKYNNTSGQSSLTQTCTRTQLISAKMKPLTSTAINMIENAVWDTYGVLEDYSYRASDIYLEEKGISAQYTGKSLCKVNDDTCNDSVKRTTSWTGLVGLISKSDISYMSYNIEYEKYLWEMIPVPSVYAAYYISSEMINDYSPCFYASDECVISPSVYLKAGIKVISGNGADKPYILAN